jgi:laccase
LIFTAELGDVVDVIFNTQHNQDHPLHLHGFKYFYLGGGPGIYNPATDASKLNLINPPLLDSVNSPGMSWTYLRIVADNPGAWLFHCVRYYMIF